MEVQRLPSGTSWIQMEPLWLPITAKVRPLNLKWSANGRQVVPPRTQAIGKWLHLKPKWYHLELKWSHPIEAAIFMSTVIMCTNFMHNQLAFTSSGINMPPAGTSWCKLSPVASLAGLSWRSCNCSWSQLSPVATPTGSI